MNQTIKTRRSAADTPMERLRRFPRADGCVTAITYFHPQQILVLQVQLRPGTAVKEAMYGLTIHPWVREFSDKIQRVRYDLDVPNQSYRGGMWLRVVLRGLFRQPSERTVDLEWLILSLPSICPSLVVESDPDELRALPVGRPINARRLGALYHRAMRLTVVANEQRLFIERYNPVENAVALFNGTRTGTVPMEAA